MLMQTAADRECADVSGELDILRKFGNSTSAPDSYQRMDKYLNRLMKTNGQYPSSLFTFEKAETDRSIGISKMRQFIDKVIDDEKLSQLIFTLLEAVKHDENVDKLRYGNRIISKSEILGTFARPKKICAEAFLLGLLIYTHQNTDTFTSENDIITSRKQDLNIYKIENSSITTLKSYAGDHMNQKGTMLCSIFEVQIYDDQLLICTTDFINTQDIRTINLNTKEENKIFTNNLHDGWIITSFQRNEQGIYVGKINSSNSQAGKTIFLNFETNKIQETDSSALYGRTPFISNKMLLHHLEKWSIYNVNDNKFYNVQIYGKDKDTYIYPTFYVLNENTILLKGTNNHFYNGILKLN